MTIIIIIIVAIAIAVVSTIWIRNIIILFVLINRELTDQYCCSLIRLEELFGKIMSGESSVVKQKGNPQRNATHFNCYRTLWTGSTIEKNTLNSSNIYSTPLGTSFPVYLSSQHLFVSPHSMFPSSLQKKRRNSEILESYSKHGKPKEVRKEETIPMKPFSTEGVSEYRYCSGWS